MAKDYKIPNPITLVIKLMKVRSRPRKPVTLRGKELEEVQDFKYLSSFISADSNKYHQK